MEELAALLKEKDEEFASFQHSAMVRAPPTGQRRALPPWPSHAFDLTHLHVAQDAYDVPDDEVHGEASGHMDEIDYADDEEDDEQYYGDEVKDEV